MDWRCHVTITIKRESLVCECTHCDSRFVVARPPYVRMQAMKRLVEEHMWDRHPDEAERH